MVIKAGAVATAIAAILGIVRLVVPHGSSPPQRLRAALTNAHVDNPVLLAAYMRELRRTPVDPGVDRAGDRVPARGGGSASTGVAPVAVVTLVATLQQSDTTTSEATTPQPSEPAPDTGTTTTTPQDTGPIGGQHPRPVTSKSQIPALPRNPNPNPGCQDTDSCPVATPQYYLRSAIDTDKPRPGSETLKALAAVRTVKPVPANFSGGATEALNRFAPVGARVFFDVEAEGYRSERLILRWSLLEARHGTSVGTSWSERLGMVLTPSALDARVNEDLWVPLPRRRGAFKLRIELTEPGGARLASIDSPAFR